MYRIPMITRKNTKFSFACRVNLIKIDIEIGGEPPILSEDKTPADDALRSPYVRAENIAEKFPSPASPQELDVLVFPTCLPKKFPTCQGRGGCR